MMFVGQDSFRGALSEFMAHYPMERDYRGIQNQPIKPGAALMMLSAPLQQRQRLGGMLRCYCGAAE
jgi:hypothetical protein